MIELWNIWLSTSRLLKSIAIQLANETSNFRVPEVTRYHLRAERIDVCDEYSSPI